MLQKIPEVVDEKVSLALRQGLVRANLPGAATRLLQQPRHFLQVSPAVLQALVPVGQAGDAVLYLLSAREVSTAITKVFCLLFIGDFDNSKKIVRPVITWRPR